MPNRLEATYIDEHGERVTPVMLHRAILGSFERFIGILLEHHAGNMPLWLAPTQVAVLNITGQQAEYAEKVGQTLKNHGFRAIYDLRNEKIGYKIRQHTLNKTNYLVIVGNSEVEEGTITVRSHDGEDLGSMTVEALIEMMNQQIDEKK